MRLVQAAKWIVLDTLRFGPRFLGHHLGRLGGKPLMRLPVPGIGPVHVRPADSDVATLRQVFGGRDYDLAQPAELGARIVRHYDALLAAGETPVIVDAGANIGAASLWFARAWPKAAVVAVEPDPENVAVLRRNLDGRVNCTVIEAAIGAERGFVSLSNGNPEGEGWAVRTTRADTGLPVVTVEDAVAGVPGGVPFIVKIDIEGFESDLFASNLDWLDRTFVMIIEPHDWMLPGRLTSRSFQQAMARHPFEMFLHGENLVYARV